MNMMVRNAQPAEAHAIPEAVKMIVLNKQKCHDWELDAKYCLEHGVCDAVVEKLSEII